ncbi:hypothetical protein CU044_4251 [Streptomyces sp. L-9-10]|nr:hypothetical protein CU044_4251 [Streptomyces sp. L-9-10]
MTPELPETGRGREGVTNRTDPARASARPSVWYVRRPAHEVTGISARDRSRTGNGQVFGLAGTSAGADSYWPSLPRSAVGSSAYDGGRSRSPLRGSPGFPPGSLLRRACLADRANQLHGPA